MNASSSCPVCDAPVALEEDVEESEILSCPECQTMLVVDRTESGSLQLAEAPPIEEDWGE